MADEKKRIINETTDTALASSGDYVIVDSQTEGTRKFDLGAGLAAIDTALDTKVDKVTGKGLSTEDYTTAEKTKLSGIEAQANKTVLDTELATTGKAADAKATGDQISQLKEDLTTESKYQMLLCDEVPDTVQVYTFSGGSVSRVAHNRSNTAIRTDVFTYTDNTITEVRTLNTGESLTIVTNLTTLETTVTYAAA